MMNTVRRANKEPHYNNLSPAEDERLAILIEQAAKVIDELSEAYMHVNNGYWKEIINKSTLSTEIGQLNYACALIGKSDLYSRSIHKTQTLARDHLKEHSKHFEINNWLNMCVQHCSQTIHAAGKVLLHGYDSKHPEKEDNNKEQLSQAVGTMISYTNEMAIALLDYELVTEAQAQKAENIKEHLHHN